MISRLIRFNQELQSTFVIVYFNHSFFNYYLHIYSHFSHGILGVVEALVIVV